MGLDEKWLQDRIGEDTSLLGLGDLHVITRERQQPSRGRIDFLMSDPEANTRYEIEIMLGSVDESHIIRTIEYWDIERQRYPSYDHRAVIVAEEITSRFFNVIRLLNRAVPLIALQISAFQFDNEVVLHITKVLDVWESSLDGDEEETSETTDRAYWERRASAKSIAVADHVRTLIPSAHSPRTTYNKFHIAVGTTGRNFLWLYPRRGSHCAINLRVEQDQRPVMIEQFEEAGISATPRGRDLIRFNLTEQAADNASQVLTTILQQSEESSL